MKWFDRWFARKCKWAWDNRDNLGPYITEDQSDKLSRKGQVIAVTEDPDWGDGLRIHINKVIGGYVVNFRVYDRHRDRSENRNYIITDEQDFERELGKIITLESMKQT